MTRPIRIPALQQLRPAHCFEAAPPPRHFEAQLPRFEQTLLARCIEEAPRPRCFEGARLQPCHGQPKIVGALAPEGWARSAAAAASLIVLLVSLAIPSASAQSSATTQPPQPPPPPVAGSVELDHVVAIVGSNVILQSDVVQEMHLSALEPLQVLPGQNTPANALRRLTDRTLILQQMKEQQQPVDTPAPEVSKATQDLRKSIPDCEKFHCGTEQGWDYFLRINGLNPEMVDQRWSQRMAILRFIDLRFRSGIHIAPTQISTYYDKTLVPALEKNHETAPPLKDVSSRIQEVLLEQQVSGLFQDWLSSLHDEGNIRIVDATYNADLSTPTGQGDQPQ